MSFVISFYFLLGNNRTFDLRLLRTNIDPGSGLNFMSACIVVEEVAKVDPAVAVLVDIQNTLISNMLR